MVSDKSVKSTLILGLGNTLLSDDGIGIYVARELARRIDHPEVEVQEASIGGLELLTPMAGFKRVILIDGMHLKNCRVGDLVKLDPADLAGGSAMARHQVSFHEALQIGRRLNLDLPEKILIYGIHVQDTRTFNESCTPEIEARIPSIVDQILEDAFNSQDR